MIGLALTRGALVRFGLLGALAAVIAGGALLIDGTDGGTEAAAQTPAPESAKPAATMSPGGAVAVGAVSGMPIPRFVSLKSDKVNVRRGPANDHDVQWVFNRAGLPVEITAEWDNWRRIRDADGSEGWVFHSLLSGRRTGLVAPWSTDNLPLRRQGDKDASVVATLQPRVLANIKSCNGSWCRIWGEGFEGFISQESLWGAYPGETFD